MNTKYSADYVITQGAQPDSLYYFWSNDAPICCADRHAIGLLVADASVRNASVYDETRDQFLCGTLGQLNPIKGARDMDFNIQKAIAERVAAGFGGLREVATSAYIQQLMVYDATTTAARSYDDYVAYLQRQHDTQEGKTMTAIPIQHLPTAILTEADILQQAAEALQEADRLQQATKTNEATLRALCRLYDKTARTWGIQPHHLRRCCEARGML